MLYPSWIASMARCTTGGGTSVSHTPCARFTPPTRSHSTVIDRISDWMTCGDISLRCNFSIAVRIEFISNTQAALWPLSSTVVECNEVLIDIAPGETIETKRSQLMTKRLQWSCCAFIYVLIVACDSGITFAGSNSGTSPTSNNRETLVR